MSFDPLEQAKKSKSFCMYPWMHLYVNTAGGVKPCCLYRYDENVGSLKENSLSEIWSGRSMSEVRLKMLNGEEVSGCANCTYLEAHSGTSPRIKINENHLTKYGNTVRETKTDGTLDEFKLRYFDVRFNNLCNHKCRTCSEDFSTLWYPDRQKLEESYPQSYPKKRENSLIFPGKNEKHVLEEMWPHLEWIDTLYFAGGEPLIQNEHYQVLDRLLELKKTDVTIIYSTNFSKLTNGDKNILAYWKKFKNISVQASVDGIGPRLEYWRKGSDWNELIKNRRRLSEECPHVQFRIVYTVTWPNLQHLPEAHRFFIENSFVDPMQDTFTINVANGPNGLPIWNIPGWKKDIIRKELNTYLTSLENKHPGAPVVQQLKETIALLDSAQENEKQSHFFVRQTLKLDEIRNEDFFSVFPEHADMRPHFNKLIATARSGGFA